MRCIEKHHVRVFVSDNRSPPRIGFFDDFDLADFDNEVDNFLKWYDSVCTICDYNLDHYELY